MANVIILGSTGSIGTGAVEVVETLGQPYRAVGLSASQSWEALAEQVAQTGAKTVAVADPEAGQRLKDRLNGKTKVFIGQRAATELVEQVECDAVISGIVGASGLEPTLAAVAAGRRVGLANKESLVVAGSLIIPLAKQTGAQVIPVDSEHSAIFQAMHAGRTDEVRKIYLTASGGPFRTWPAAKIAEATVTDALAHPTWDMGPKITIDSATMMNKALEIIEACWLFDVDPDVIEVVVHPESIVHSMVEFNDGSVIAQLGSPDMRTPIQYALTFPQRLACCSRRLEVATLGAMHFEPPDFERFGALRLGFEVARRKGTSGAVLNAANEAAVELFRAGRITFGQITDLAVSALGAHTLVAEPTLEQLMAADAWARAHVYGACNEPVGGGVRRNQTTHADRV